jgi:N-sulfoglucosamine sulfohydrolase
MLDYGLEIDWFDHHLMEMILKLEELGELDNEIIIVTSDQGMPFPRAKANLYDYLLCVPLAISRPDWIKIRKAE